ncbi:hypothetical protein U0070_021716 [Myodes glareolus]|uniref:Uncharacterized protein n=1 Tax=Myodes glareolus TaxID=447135 RepID=A0AAW0HSA5_MYOGA
MPGDVHLKYCFGKLAPGDAEDPLWGEDNEKGLSTDLSGGEASVGVLLPDDPLHNLGCGRQVL